MWKDKLRQWDKNVTYVPFGLLLLVSCYGTYRLGRSYEAYQFKVQDYAQSEQSKATPRIIRECVGLEPRAFAKCVDDTVESGAQREREAYNLVAQQKVAEGSELLIVLGIFELALTLWGILVLRDQLVANQTATDAMVEANRITEETAQKTLEETRRIGEAQTRAYLTISSCNVSFQEGKITLQPTIRNTGQSPALDVRWHGELWLMVDGKPDQMRQSETIKSLRNLTYDVPAQGEREALYINCEDDYGLGGAETAAFADSKDVTLHVCIRAYGKDVFGGDISADEQFIEIFERAPLEGEAISMGHGADIQDEENEEA